MVIHRHCCPSLWPHRDRVSPCVNALLPASAETALRRQPCLGAVRVPLLRLPSRHSPSRLRRPGQRLPVTDVSKAVHTIGPIPVCRLANPGSWTVASQLFRPLFGLLPPPFRRLYVPCEGAFAGCKRVALNIAKVFRQQSEPGMSRAAGDKGVINPGPSVVDLRLPGATRGWRQVLQG